MNFSVFSIAYLALFYCGVFSKEEVHIDVSPKGAKILHKKYYSEVKKCSENTTPVCKNLGTNLMSSIKNIVSGKAYKHDESSSFQKRISLKNIKILDAVVGFFKNTGHFISKALIGVKSHIIKRNKTLGVVSSTISNKQVKINVSNIIDKGIKNTFKPININDQNCSNLLLNKSFLLGALELKQSESDSALESNVANVIYKRENFSIGQRNSYNGSIKHSDKLISNGDKDIELDQATSNIFNYQVLPSSNELEIPEYKHEFSIETFTNAQLKPTKYRIQESPSTQNLRIGFMSHSEEYKKLWKPVLKMKVDERQARIDRWNFTERTMSNSGEKHMTHSEEYRMKWQPLIEHMYQKPGRRLMPGRSFKRTTEKSVDEYGAMIRSEILSQNATGNLNRDIHNNTRPINKTLHSTDKPTTFSADDNKGHGLHCEKVEKTTYGRKDLHTIASTSQVTTFTADESALEVVREHYNFSDQIESFSATEQHVLPSAPTLLTFSDSKPSLHLKKNGSHFDRNTRSNKAVFLGLSAEDVRPWAETRFQRVSNNIGLDQHFKTISSKWSRAVSPLTARPNNSRVSFDNMFS